MSEREEGFYWVWFPRSLRPEWEIMYWSLGTWKATGYDDVIPDDPEFTVSDRIRQPAETPPTLEALPPAEPAIPLWQWLLAQKDETL